MKKMAFFRFKSYYVYSLSSLFVFENIFLIYSLIENPPNLIELFCVLTFLVLSIIVIKILFVFKNAKTLRYVDYDLTLAEIKTPVTNALKKRHDIQLDSVVRGIINRKMYLYRIKDLNATVKITPLYIMIKNDDRNIVENTILDVLSNIKNKTYNKNCIYLIDKNKLNKLKKDVIFEEPEEDWEKLLKKRKLSRIFNYTLILLYVPVSVIFFKMDFINSRIDWQGMMILWIVMVPVGLTLYNGVIQFHPDLLKYRQRFIVTKDKICPPWKKAHHYERSSRRKHRDCKEKNVCIGINEIKRIFPAHRIINKLEGREREVWVIETVDGYEYYILPKFRKTFLKVLEQIAVRKYKKRPGGCMILAKSH